MNRPADPLLLEAEAIAWSARNQRWLSQRFAAWRARLAHDTAAIDGVDHAEAGADRDDGFEPAALQLRALFGLSPFETDLLLLAAGLELDMALRHAVARAQGAPSVEPLRLRFSLALALLPDAHWDALSPLRPLRHWALLQVDTDDGLSQAQLRVDERVLHHLTGVAACDERLLGIAQHETADGTANTALAERIAQTMAPLAEPLVLLGHAAHDAAGRRQARALATAVFAQLGQRTLWIDSAALAPLAHADARELSLLARRLDREAALTQSGIALALEAEPAAQATAVRLAAALRSRLIASGTLGALQLAQLPTRRVLRFPLPPAVATPLEGVSPSLRHAAQRALQQFHVEPALLQQALDATAGVDDAAAPQALWSALRESARGGLDALAQRIASRADFDDLVLPPRVAAQLKEIAGQLGHRRQVYEDWGFGEREGRGLGIAALFAGESGTGKTLAAEAIANECGLDLYRIDLASVVSKYIGETEKNLGKLFDAAECSGAVLLFDEADALFGKRSDVKDSHDRYANIEVAYLLQRIECYRGLAILTTNLKSALDRAFMRRIRFVVQFPMPDEAARERIWRRQLPARSPRGEIDFARLAKLQLSGGHIRSVVLTAAFQAAARGAPIAHELLLDAAREEFMKLDRPFGDAFGRSA